MSILSIEVNSPEVLEALREMEREGKLRITEEKLGERKEKERRSISDFQGILKMSPERLQAWLDSVKEGREERIERLPS